MVCVAIAHFCGEVLHRRHQQVYHQAGCTVGKLCNEIDGTANDR